MQRRQQVEQNPGERFLAQSDPYKISRRGNLEDRSRGEKSPRLPINHGSNDKTHIAAVLLKDVIYDHFSDTYDFHSWEWFLYVLGAVDDPPGEEPKHAHEIRDWWSPQKPWDWLGGDTVIASKEPEVQWILRKLVDRLVQELVEIRKEISRRSGRGGGC